MSRPGKNTGEFGIIETILAPLARSMPGALGLTDDAALLSVSEGHELVLTKDAMVAGVHFFADDAPAKIAQKLLRTNLSDLAAMGAKPVGYLLASAWSPACDDNFIREFASGLQADQLEFEIGLLGGDTVKTEGPLTLSLTALGEVPSGTALRRNGAHEGDYLYVSGTIGDGGLGLLARQGEFPDLPAEDIQFLVDRYLVPEPRVKLGQLLREYASACLDISDGLLADVAHLCRQSGVGAHIDQPLIPLSKAAKSVLKRRPDLWEAVFSGGDDYELCFAIPAKSVKEFTTKARKIGHPVQHIGQMINGSSPSVVDKDGQEIPYNKAGWTHF